MCKVGPESDTFVATVKPIRFNFISAESPKCRLMSRHGSVDLGQFLYTQEKYLRVFMLLSYTPIVTLLKPS